MIFHPVKEVTIPVDVVIEVLIQTHIYISLEILLIEFQCIFIQNPVVIDPEQIFRSSPIRKFTGHRSHRSHSCQHFCQYPQKFGSLTSLRKIGLEAGQYFFFIVYHIDRRFKEIFRVQFGFSAPGIEIVIFDN